MAEPLILLNNVTRHFVAGTQLIPVLKSISLAIMPGEMVAIMGASGSGKSTLMNIIGCLDKPSSGEVYINGIAAHQADSAALAELRSRWLGFIFQRYHLMPYLTAEENIAIPALYTAMPAAERQARIALLAEKLDIDARLAHKPAQLSGGQQQRVSVCRALINGAQIILADEPTGALDSVSGRALMDVLHQLNADGHTVIIVTHDREVAQQAQRIVEISDGRWSPTAPTARVIIAAFRGCPRYRITAGPRCRAVSESRYGWHGGRCWGIVCAPFCRCWGLSSAFRPWFPPWRWEKALGRAS